MPLPMTPTITAFERSPDRGRGLARDMRVSAYVARGEARPAYKRAFDAQLAVFTASGVPVLHSAP